MITKHAITIQGDITVQHVSYMVKQANLIGISQRKIHRIYSQEDDEGIHIYFEVDGIEKKHCY